MGYGEVTGNGSVHWELVHEDPRTGEPTRVIARNVEGRKIRHLRRSDPETMHWGDVQVLGRDTITFGEIGTTRDPATGRSKGHPGRFRVRIRFANRGDAIGAALSGALKVKRVGDQWVLQIDVPAIDRTEEQMDPVNPPSEIRVDW